MAGKNEDKAPMSNFNELRQETREIAHDLGNLLQAICLCSYKLAACLPNNSPLRGLAITIRKTAASCAQLTYQLRVLDDQNLQYNNTVDLNSVVLDAELLLREHVSSETCLKVVPSPEAALVTARPGDVQRIVMNLAMNALKAMGGTGQLTIRVEYSGPDNRQEQQHPAASLEGYGKIVVQDTGTGMDEDTLTRILEPSFATKPPDAGRGIGLASVKSILHRAGGHIEIDSIPGVGTTFSVFLPRSLAPAAQI